MILILYSSYVIWLEVFGEQQTKNSKELKKKRFKINSSLCYPVTILLDSKKLDSKHKETGNLCVKKCLYLTSPSFLILIKYKN
ncbi:hypothetical protein DERF_009196 [Dermatophagoides farinae]|uniref:Uncharacterized protein n=1 Tax=Dermatophagoides farinae TaxID=6954 RepID=A0A922HW80_DERFA|nr:hypothetical protein DERF_009196 [Dermatophagoides farinae]